MWASSVSDKISGRLVPTIEGQMAFVPNDLPPNLVWTADLIGVLSEANLSLGQLCGVGLNIPNPNLLITPFIRREAELCSRIEGTHTTIEQLYLFEVQQKAVEMEVPDVREVANYVHALEYGLRRCAELPVCLRLIRELHEILLKDVRGEKRMPGEFRKIQNFIGPPSSSINEAIYVPPPPKEMEISLDAFEKFLNMPLMDMPAITWLAMVHYQFETIHPFLDGNGRIGRLLIILLLCSKGVLDKPLLYLSAYFERNREQYYERLQRVRTHGEWAEWILFFLRGISEQSKDAVERSRQLLELQQKYRDLVKERRSTLQVRLVDLLIERPVVTIASISKRFDVSYVAAANNVASLVKVGVLKEATGRQRNRIYVAEEVLDTINKPFAKVKT